MRAADAQIPGDAELAHPVLKSEEHTLLAPSVLPVGRRLQHLLHARICLCGLHLHEPALQQ
eukprot:scaffold66139_cov69-Phaeocystis_antarctica.AAC.2